MKFWRDHASFPFKSHDLWFLAENMRWGKFETNTDAKALVDKVNRADLWREAAKDARRRGRPTSRPATAAAWRPSSTARCSIRTIRRPISRACRSSASPDRRRTGSWFIPHASSPSRNPKMSSAEPSRPRCIRWHRKPVSVLSRAVRLGAGIVTQVAPPVLTIALLLLRLADRWHRVPPRRFQALSGDRRELGHHRQPVQGRERHRPGPLLARARPRCTASATAISSLRSSASEWASCSASRRSPCAASIRCSRFCAPFRRWPGCRCRWRPSATASPPRSS